MQANSLGHIQTDFGTSLSGLEDHNIAGQGVIWPRRTTSFRDSEMVYLDPISIWLDLEHENNSLIVPGNMQTL